MDVRVIEVGPRDGLQNEQVHLSVAERVELITRLVDAGATRIEQWRSPILASSLPWLEPKR